MNCFSFPQHNCDSANVGLLGYLRLKKAWSDLYYKVYLLLERMHLPFVFGEKLTINRSQNGFLLVLTLICRAYLFLGKHRGMWRDQIKLDLHFKFTSH